MGENGNIPDFHERTKFKIVDGGLEGKDFYLYCTSKDNWKVFKYD